MAEQEHTGVAVMAFLAEPDAKRLAIPGGEPVDNLHVTLGYLAEPAAEVGSGTRSFLNLMLKSLNKRYMPLVANVFATARFNYNNAADDEHPPCTVLLVQSTELADLHNNVQTAVYLTPLVNNDETFPIWVPHITLGYNIDPAKLPDAGPVTFDRLGVGYGGDITFL